jgi:hypothetical protein
MGTVAMGASTLVASDAALAAPPELRASVVSGDVTSRAGSSKYIGVVCDDKISGHKVCGVYDYYGDLIPKIILGKVASGQKLHANQNQLKYHTSFQQHHVPSTAKRNITWFVAKRLKGPSTAACNGETHYRDPGTEYGICHAFILYESNKHQVGTGGHLKVRKSWLGQRLFLKVVYHYKLHGKKRTFTLWSEDHKVRS